MMILSGVVAEEIGRKFDFYRSLTIDHTLVPSTDQANFPVLIVGTYSYLATIANGGRLHSASGYDIAFSSDVDGNNLLPFELVSYDPTTGAVEFWVKVPTVSHSVDTVIYVQYGKASIITDQSNRAAVWSNGFISVQHLQGNSGDSSGNGFNGTDTAITYGAEKIQEGATFNGSTSGITQGSSAALGEGAAFSASAWVKFSTLPNGYNTVEAKSFASAGGRTLLIKSSGKLAVYLDTTVTYNQHVNYDGSGSNTLSAGVWYLLAYTIDGSGNTTVKGYVNGAVDGSNVGTGPCNVGPIGAAGAVQTWGHDAAFDPRFFACVMDELRLASVVRTADWFATEFNNQNSPSTFYALGSEIAH
jgi:hypothetical protein